VVLANEAMAIVPVDVIVAVVDVEAASFLHEDKILKMPNSIKMG
jgi:hypothetical protein